MLLRCISIDHLHDFSFSLLCCEAWLIPSILSHVESFLPHQTPSYPLPFHPHHPRCDTSLAYNHLKPPTFYTPYLPTYSPHLPLPARPSTAPATTSATVLVPGGARAWRVHAAAEAMQGGCIIWKLRWLGIGAIVLGVFFLSMGFATWGRDGFPPWFVLRVSISCTSAAAGVYPGLFSIFRPRCLLCFPRLLSTEWCLEYAALCWCLTVDGQPISAFMDPASGCPQRGLCEGGACILLW